MSPRWLRLAIRLLAVAGAIYTLVRTLAARMCTVEVAGGSMTPTLTSGEYLLLRRGPPPNGSAARGLIVAAHGPDGRLLLKRIVGVPGDSLRVGEHVFVNGALLVEPYAHGSAAPAQYRGVHRLEPHQYFLLGDHRTASTDSRDFGPVAVGAIVGVAWLRYWPPARVGLLDRAGDRG